MSCDHPPPVATEVRCLARCLTGRLRWGALSEWEPVLFGPNGLRLDQWRANRQAEVVKQGPHRTVYSVKLADRAFYVKHYRSDRFWDIARRLVRASSARREWRNVTEVIRRGIPTTRPVAWQEELRGGMVRDSYFISETLPGVCSLQEYALKRFDAWPNEGQLAIRRRLIEGLARFVAAIHRAGVFHNDFHAGNLLLRINPPSESGDSCGNEEPPDRPVEFFLIDVPGVRFSASLGWSASRDNLIVLNSGWYERTSRSERRRFWRTYLAERPDLNLPDQRLPGQRLESDAFDYSQRRARRRDKRTLRTNRDFITVRHDGSRAHAVRDLAPADLKRLLKDPDALLQRNLNRPVKLDRASLIVEADLPLAQGNAHVFYKRYRPRNWRKALLAKCRPGKALGAWRRGHALLLRRIATARPLAVCDLRRPWYRCCSYLAVEWIEGSRNLHLYAWELATRPAAERLRRATQCAESLGKLIGRMHARHLTHGDLKGSNLLVRQRPDDVQTHLVDVDDVRIANSLTLAGRAADLARLAVSIQAHPWVSRTVRRRFLRAYVAQSPSADVAWKSLWREVARRSDRITRRKRRRGKPIL